MSSFCCCCCCCGGVVRQRPYPCQHRSVMILWQYKTGFSGRPVIKIHKEGTEGLLEELPIVLWPLEGAGATRSICTVATKLALKNCRCPAAQPQLQCWQQLHTPQRAATALLGSRKRRVGYCAVAGFLPGRLVAGRLTVHAQSCCRAENSASLQWQPHKQSKIA